MRTRDRLYGRVYKSSNIDAQRSIDSWTMSAGSQSLPLRGSSDHAESSLTLDPGGKQQQPRDSKNLYDVQSVFAAKLKSICIGHFDIAVLCVVIVVVWVLLALPTIFYHQPQSSQSPTDGLMDTCIPESYTGSICREVLQTQQGCLPDRNATGDIIIAMDPTSSQEDKESEANIFIGGLPVLNPSPECMEAVVPFLCFYIFPLCDSSGRPYQPSSAECSAVTNGICAREFETAARFASDQLPQCQLLPDSTLECNLTDGTNFMVRVEGDTLLNTSTERVCSDGFFINENTGFCIPECGVWEEFPHSFVVGVDAVVILSAIINLLSSVVVLVCSCISYKRMFSFPSVFIVYSVIALVVLEALFIIGYFDRTSLFCNSRDLSVSIEDVTSFCTLQGLAFYYAALVLLMFWFFHIVILFWRIKFPFHAKHFESRGYFRYVHVVMVIAAVLLPLGSLGAILGSGGLAIPRFPPVLCFAKETDVTYFSFVLIVSIVLAIGVSMLAIILWVLIAKLGRLRNNLKPNTGGIEQTTQKNTISSAELKVLIIFVYFFIFGIFSITAFTIGTQNITEFVSELTMHFACESQGVQPGRTCERDFNRMPSEIALIFVYIFLGFYPTVNLIYVINIQDIKKCWSQNITYETRSTVQT